MSWGLDGFAVAGGVWWSGFYPAGPAILFEEIGRVGDAESYVWQHRSKAHWLF